MIGGILSTLQNLRGGFVHPFISCRGCYIHPVKNMRGVLSTYAKMSRGCFVRGVFCPTFEQLALVPFFLNDAFGVIRSIINFFSGGKVCLVVASGGHVPLLPPPMGPALCTVCAIS